MMRRRIALLLGAVMAAMTIAVPTAFAGGVDEDVKCNAGRGNGSEPAPVIDCDPGNSAGNNKGGD